MSYDDSITNPKHSASKGTSTWANNMQTAIADLQGALGGGDPQESSDWIVYYDATSATYKTRNGDDGTIDSNNALFQTVFSEVMALAATGEVITFKGNFNVVTECNITKGVTLNCYGATFTWTGAHDVEHSMIKATPVVDGVKILGGKFLVNHKDVWPLGTLTLTNSLIKDITVNHTIRTANVVNVRFEHITQLGEYGAQGYDCGINIIGHEVTVDGYYADLTTEYHGCFVIGPATAAAADVPNNITIRNVYIKGLLGSFVNWYYPRQNTTQYVGGRCTVENFYWELEGIPKWGNFAPFLMFDHEFIGVGETYSANYGTIVVENGKIFGPSLTLTGSENGIQVKSLCWLWYEGLEATVDITFRDITVNGMRGTDATTDYLTMRMAGRLVLDNVKYTGAWDTSISWGCTNLELIVTNCDFDVAANALTVFSWDSGTSYVSLLHNRFSDSVHVSSNVGHTMHLAEMGSILPVHTDPAIIVDAGTPQRYDARDIVPASDGIFYLGRWAPQQQWLGLYLSDDGYIIWENDTQLTRHAANELMLNGSFMPSSGVYDLGKDEATHRFGVCFLGAGGGVHVGDNQVVGPQGAAIADLGTSGADEDGTCRGKVNAILARLRAHGLIDT